MIISASRRTDIPAFYSTWFMRRLKEGYVLIPNPRNPSRLGRITLSPQLVDCIVFWTKNPAPMLDRLSELDAMGYDYYIQFTLTPYGNAMEPNLPPKEELIETFIKMSKRIGAQRSVWRYDPIIVDARHSTMWHIHQFSKLCGRLQGYTQRCVVSFLDIYTNIKDRFRAPASEEMNRIAPAFFEIAQNHGMALFTCAEEIDLTRYGIAHGACIDQALIESITGSRINAKNDANQRAACRCIESVDVGAYDTCSHGCAYCYATSSQQTALRRMAAHDPQSPMLTGHPSGDEIITERTTPSQKTDQLRWF